MSTVTKKDNFPPMKNDRILRAAKGEVVDRIPVWIMRQAGRYLPEFREFRTKHNFFEICRTPELACEVTLMPIRRYKLDAAIIFSDILVIPQALGMEVQMKPDVGPYFPEPLVNPSDIAKLNTENVTERLNYVGEAITLTRHQLKGEVPLIGFAGAPWTIMSYMIEGGGSKTMSKSKAWLYKYPKESEQLLETITNVTIDYLLMQIDAGAQMLQIFESNCEYLSPHLFTRFAAPCLKRICSEIRARTENVFIPLILFCKGGAFCLTEQKDMGYNVLGLDWTTDPQLARYIVGPDIVLQGNLDPVALQAPTEQLTTHVKHMISGFGKQNYIANLGHGIYPDAPVESVETFVNVVHQY